MENENNAISQEILIVATDGDPNIENPVQETPPQPPQTAATADILKDPEIQAYITLQIKEGIAEALRGITPKANGIDNLAAQQLQFSQMSYKERLQLFNTNPQQYYKLAKGSK